MKAELEELEINGVVYVKKGSATIAVKDAGGLKYVVVRTYSAGVHCGYLKEQNETGKIVTLIHARRFYRWAGAFTLSEVAMFGSAKPQECKVSCVVLEIQLTEAIEVIQCSDVAAKNIKGIPTWSV